MRSDIGNFRRIVRTHYRKNGRHALPWRRTRDPYRILVSEIMLQQTRVDRVVSYYKSFLKRFPTVQTLADAPLGDVLGFWQGLGYNRRAKYLHEAAKIIVSKHAGRVPAAYRELIELPGVGEYTAKAIRVFACNEPELMIETNIRAVFLHHFFPGKRRNISDRALVPYMVQALDSRKPREWYWALMDYGSHVKSLHPNPSRRSAHHTKQTVFRGSNREVRGAIVRALVLGGKSEKSLHSLPFAGERIRIQIKKLHAEGLIRKERSTFSLPS